MVMAEALGSRICIIVDEKSYIFLKIIIMKLEKKNKIKNATST